MAFTKLVSLIAFASCALLLSSQSVNAVAIEGHGQLAARHHALAQNMAVKKRSSNSGRCKPRTTTSAAAQSTAQSTSTAETTSSSTSTKAQTTSSKASSSSSTSSKATSTSTSSKATSTSTSSTSTSTSGANAGDSGNTMRGAAWATDNTWAPEIIPSGSKISWYYHWADGVVPQLDSIEFVPMLWGPNDVSTFNQIMSGLNGAPAHILGMNEPDISSQSNMSPGDAANLWMQQIAPWGKKGSKLCSPAIAYSIDWMAQFLSAIESQGGYVDCVVLHWYGDAKNIDQLMSYVEQAHSQFNKPIWVTEIGVTTASGPSDASTLSFAQNVIHQFEGLGYVERIAWFGFFPSDQPIDNFASATNSLLQGQNQLTNFGNWYVYGN